MYSDIQNHGFGGSDDQDLMDCAPDLLYPYNPGIVVFQTGSNDYVHVKGNVNYSFHKNTKLSN